MIDRVLERLLHDRAYRATFLRDPAALGLAPDLLEALATIDPAELVATAQAVHDDLAQRVHRGNGTLLQLYAASLGDHDPRAILAEFQESEWHEAYREVPYAGIGLALEDAFYRFLVARGIGDALTRTKEHHAAMTRALVACPEPDFTLPPELHACPAGTFALAGTTLFAALGGRYVTGELDALLVTLLTTDDAALVHANEAAVSELRRLGLLP